MSAGGWGAGGQSDYHHRARSEDPSWNAIHVLREGEIVFSEPSRGTDGVSLR